MKLNVKFYALTVVMILIMSVVLPVFASEIGETAVNNSAPAIEDSTPAIGDNKEEPLISYEVKSNPPTTQKVKVGDEITYEITLKNVSETIFIAPMITAVIPEGTEFVSITIADGEVIEESTGYNEEEKSVTCQVGKMLVNGEDDSVTFLLKVKVVDENIEKIKFAHLKDEDEETNGAIIYIAFKEDAVLDEEKTMEILSKFEAYTEEELSKMSTNEIKELLGDLAEIDVITAPQVHEVEKTEIIPEEKVEEKVEEKPAEEAKPTVYPKTGMEINYTIAIASTVMIILGVSIILNKK